jgi:hypothetical protein
MSNLDRCVEEFGSNCFFCESEEAEIVHFIDGDRSNDSISNMRPSCGECHIDICSSNTEYIKWSQKLANPPIEEPELEQIVSALENSERPYIRLSKVSDEYHMNTDDLRQYVSEQSTNLNVGDVQNAKFVIYHNNNSESSNKTKKETKKEVSKEEDSKDLDEESDDSEHISLFPDRKEIVVSNPQNKTTTELSKTAHLEDMNNNSLMYRLEKEDVWNSPFKTFEDYVSSLEEVVEELTPRLRERLESYWNRANMFELRSVGDKTHLIGDNHNVFENVAKRNLEHNKYYTKFVNNLGVEPRGFLFPQIST